MRDDDDDVLQGLRGRLGAHQRCQSAELHEQVAGREVSKEQRIGSRVVVAALDEDRAQLATADQRREAFPQSTEPGAAFDEVGPRVSQEGHHSVAVADQKGRRRRASVRKGQSLESDANVVDVDGPRGGHAFVAQASKRVFAFVAEVRPQHAVEQMITQRVDGGRQAKHGLGADVVDDGAGQAFDVIEVGVGEGPAANLVAQDRARRAARPPQSRQHAAGVDGQVGRLSAAGEQERAEVALREPPLHPQGDDVEASGGRRCGRGLGGEQREGQEREQHEKSASCFAPLARRRWHGAKGFLLCADGAKGFLLCAVGTAQSADGLSRWYGANPIVPVLRAQHDAGMRSALAVCTVVAAACAAPPTPPPAPVWSPGVLYPAQGAVDRGLVDVRGLVHAHSVYSHDACDGAPVGENGVRDAVCADDFRRGLCQSQHDFVFLTDHSESFDTTEFPETLLFEPALGDVLVDRGGGPTANRITCDDGHDVLIMAGTEHGLMPVGLERHLEDRSLYGDVEAARGIEAAAALHEAGAVVLLAHPEDYTPEQLRVLPVDGFEMYNLHANMLLGSVFALDLVLRAVDDDPGLPHPDLMVLTLWSEDSRYLERWGKVLASGKRIVSTMGTDCHRNTFRTVLADGERADSYRRMMIAFSNHLLVKADDPSAIDDADLKEALAHGRAWGAFEMLGYPVGFDATATSGGDVFEIGDDVPVGSTIHARMPTVRDLDPQREPPRVVLRLLRAEDSAAGFTEVAQGESDLDVVADVAGAWRVEVRMLPLHLRQDLGDEDFRILDERADEGHDYVWIYANPFYVQ